MESERLNFFLEYASKHTIKVSETKTYGGRYFLCAAGKCEECNVRVTCSDLDIIEASVNEKELEELTNNHPELFI